MSDVMDATSLTQQIKAWVGAGEYAQAEEYLRAFMKEHGEQKPLLVLLVQLLKPQEKWQRLVDASTRLLILDPEYDEPGFMLDYGLALQFEGEFKRALVWHLKLLQRVGDKPDMRGLMADVMYNVGTAYDALGEFEKAQRFYSMALEREPSHSRSHFALATIAIKCSNLARGFDEYHKRFMLENQPRNTGYDCPPWQGEAIDGKRLVVWSEQGIGDVVMFCSFVPYLLSRAASLTLEVAEYLVDIVARSFPDAVVVAKQAGGPSDAVKAGQYDYVIPMGDLLRLLTDYRPSSAHHYLKPDVARRDALRARYQQPGKKLVGISWRTINTDSAIRRDIPLQLWGPILSVPNVRFVSLQYNGEQAELDDAKRRLGVDILFDYTLEPMKNREDFFAQVAAMDAVVSIQNSTVHAGGAMGVPTAIMLSKFGDFRWGVSGEDNAWYESVKMIRQAEYGDWAPAIASAAEWLKRLVIGN